jgi:hypothetical protein
MFTIVVREMMVLGRIEVRHSNLLYVFDSMPNGVRLDSSIPT